MPSGRDMVKARQRTRTVTDMKGSSAKVLVTEKEITDLEMPGIFPSTERSIDMNIYTSINAQDC